MTLPPAPRGTVVLAGLALAVTTLAGCGTGTTSGPVTTGAGPADGAGTTTSGPATTTDDGGTMPEDRTTDLGPGAVLTPDDDGATLRLRAGEEASLRLPPPWDATPPEVSDPGVVELVPVDHFADPGYAEHGLLALGAGEAVVRVDGPDGTVEIRVVVEP